MKTMMGGLDGEEILRLSLGVAPNVAYYLPRNTQRERVRELAEEARVQVSVEMCALNGHAKALMAYYGFEEEEEEGEGEENIGQPVQ